MRLAPAERLRSRGWLFAGAGGVLVAAALAVAEPSDDPARSICVWRRTTGVPCPGCGMVRAAAHLLRGDATAALAYHPLVGAVVVQLAVAWGWWALAATGRARAPAQTTVGWWLGANLALLLGTWGVRALTGTLPP